MNKPLGRLRAFTLKRRVQPLNTLCDQCLVKPAEIWTYLFHLFEGQTTLFLCRECYETYKPQFR